MTVLPEHRCELIYLMPIVLVKDIGTNMHGLGLPLMPLEGAKIAKWGVWRFINTLTPIWEWYGERHVGECT